MLLNIIGYIMLISVTILMVAVTIIVIKALYDDFF